MERTANGTHTKPLSSEKVLRTQLDAANETLRRLTSVLAAVLVDHHRGRLLITSETVNAMYGDAEQPNGFMVHVQTVQPLNKHLLQVIVPDGSTYESPPVVIEAANKPSAACTEEWHRSGIGLRCPKCGSAERIQ
jgi:hypothetical protein